MDFKSFKTEVIDEYPEVEMASDLTAVSLGVLRRLNIFVSVSSSLHATSRELRFGGDFYLSLSLFSFLVVYCSWSADSNL